MQKVLITGAGGQLGKDVIKVFNKKNNNKIITTNSKTLDITNLEQVREFLQEQKPNVIINCAGYNGLEECEIEKEKAYKVNTIGPENLAITSNEINAKIVQISTNYVFDGETRRDAGGKRIPYTEFDSPNPQNTYGKTKYEAEKSVQKHNSKHYIIRTSWLYGRQNNFIEELLNYNKLNEELKLINDQYTTPTSTEELAKMINFIINTENYGLFHATCEGECTLYQLAKTICEIKNISLPIIPITSKETNHYDKIPRYIVLDNYMLRNTTQYKLPQWKDTLEKYLSA